MSKKPVFESNPKPNWTFKDAATLFLETRKQFLRAPDFNADPVGIWELTCFPFKGYVNKTHITGGQAEHLNGILAYMRVYQNENLDQCLKKIIAVFRVFFEYPPYPLNDNWDGKAGERIKHAVYIYECRNSG